MLIKPPAAAAIAACCYVFLVFMDTLFQNNHKKRVKFNKTTIVIVSKYESMSIFMCKM